MSTVLYNPQKIKSVLKNFHTLTGIPVCLYDSDFNAVAYYGEAPKYCCFIRKHSVRNTKCATPDKVAAQKCVKDNTFITYTCHAGITETVAPIIYDNVVLGYLLFGGIKDKEKKYANPQTIATACKKYGLDKNEYLEYYKTLKTFDKQTMNACTEIMAICIKYIISEKYIKFDDSIFSSKVIAYLNEHYKEDVTFEQLCSVFHVGKNYLYKTLKNQTGQTINNYLISIRMKNAKKLLEQTDKSVSEIASLVGFYDYNYFIRIFKRYFQTTPLKYRKTYDSTINSKQDKA